MGIGSIVIGGFIGGIAVWFLMRKKCDFNPMKGVTPTKSSGVGNEIFDPFGSIDDNPEGNYPSQYSFRNSIKMY